jgi:hypothetical protein
MGNENRWHGDNLADVVLTILSEARADSGVASLFKPIGQTAANSLLASCLFDVCDALHAC